MSASEARPEADTTTKDALSRLAVLRRWVLDPFHPGAPGPGIPDKAGQSGGFSKISPVSGSMARCPAGRFDRSGAMTMSSRESGSAIGSTPSGTSGWVKQKIAVAAFREGLPAEIGRGYRPLHGE